MRIKIKGGEVKRLEIQFYDNSIPAVKRDLTGWELTPYFYDTTTETRTAASGSAGTITITDDNRSQGLVYFNNSPTAFDTNPSGSFQLTIRMQNGSQDFEVLRDNPVIYTLVNI